MFGKGAISSSEWLVPSVQGVLETVLPFRTLRSGERSSPRCWTGSWRPELGVVRGSRLQEALEGDWGTRLSIWQSAGEVSGAWVIGPFPLMGVVASSGVQCRIGVRTRSGVRERSEVCGTGDWPRPDLADLVLFRLTCGERFLDGALSELARRAPPSWWLVLAVVGGFWTSATSPTTS